MFPKPSPEDLLSLPAHVQEYINMLEHNVTHDSLTGALTCSAFLEIAGHELLSIKRAKTGSFLMLFFDVNDFKNINDSYGHLVGDEVLKEIVKRCQILLREADIIARYAGDEFIGLIEINNDNDKDIINHILNKIMTAMGRPLIFGDKIISFSISVGAIVVDKETFSLNEAIKKVDEAMYKAKEEKDKGSIYVVVK